MNADEFRKAAHSAIEEIISYNDSLPNLPVLPTISPGYLAPLLPTTAPSQPESWPSIQADIESKILPGLTHWQSPNFMAFFPASTTYPSLLGEMYSAAFTAPAFNWFCSPACTELETVVLDWLAKAMRLPDAFLSTSKSGGGGVIQGSASEAIVTCMVAAREKYIREKCLAEGLVVGSTEQEDRAAWLRTKLVALSTDQAHSSTQKGAAIAGTRYRSFPALFDEDLEMTGERLERAIEECERDGLEPYYLTATLGTTSTCAVDRFEEIGQVNERRKAKGKIPMWIHIDAAYGGGSLICEEFQHYSQTLTMADSFDMNMHKWLLVNFDASCLYVQNRNNLTRTLSIAPSYLQNTFTDSGLVTDYRDWQIPLGRRFRALKIWFVMRSYGLEGLKAHIRNTLHVGEVFKNLVESREDLYEIIAPPRFGLTCFRVKPSVLAHGMTMNGRVNGSIPDWSIHIGGNIIPKKESPPPDFRPRTDSQAEAEAAAAAAAAEAEANAITKQIADLVNERGQIFITSSTAARKGMIRVVSGNEHANEKSVRNAFDIILQATYDVLEKRMLAAPVPNGMVE